MTYLYVNSRNLFEFACASSFSSLNFWYELEPQTCLFRMHMLSEFYSDLLTQHVLKILICVATVSTVYSVCDLDIHTMRASQVHCHVALIDSAYV